MTEHLVQTTLTVIGLKGNEDRERAAQALWGVSGVRGVEVNLMRGRVTVLHEVTCLPATLVWAIVTAGFGAALDGVEACAS